MSEPLPVFVYGTLRPGGRNFGVVAPLVRAARPAVMPGLELRDHGPFPFARPGGFEVVGDLLELASPADHLAVLDEFEGVPDGLYRRVAMPALAAGALVPAWTYLAGDRTPDLDAMPLVDPPDWVAWRHR